MTRCEPRFLFASDESVSGRGIGPAGRTAGFSAVPAGFSALVFTAGSALIPGSFGLKIISRTLKFLIIEGYTGQTGP